MQLDHFNLARLLAACEEVAEQLPQSMPLNPVEILHWPGVVREEEIDTKPLVEGALAQVQGAREVADGVARPALCQLAPNSAPQPQLTIIGRRPEVTSIASVEAWAL